VNEKFVDFRDIKQRISMQAVLDHYGVRLRKSTQHSLRGKCPLPTHTSEKSNESFSVETTKNIWACQSTSCASARQGKKGGNVIDFVAVMENCSVRDAALKLHEWFGASKTIMSNDTSTAPAKKADQLVARKEADDAKGENKPLPFSLKDIDPTHPYLRERGIDEAVAQYFGVGYFPGRGSMNGRVVIPIQNERGELIAYAGRSIDRTEPKYKLPAGFKKSDVLFEVDPIVWTKKRPSLDGEVG